MSASSERTGISRHHQLGAFGQPEFMPDADVVPARDQPGQGGAKVSLDTADGVGEPGSDRNSHRAVTEALVAPMRGRQTIQAWLFNDPPRRVNGET